MNEEIQILEKQIESMAGIFNAVPGEVFRLSAGETLLILQRRMNACDLLSEISRYNDIFSKSNGASIQDIVKSAVAYIRIRCLVNGKSDQYTPVLLRQLIKDYKNQITKVTNIIHLSKVNALTADAYQKENIKVMQEKNESFLTAFQKEIDELETIIERHPVSEAERKPQEKKTEIENQPVRKSVWGEAVSKFQKLSSDRKSKYEVEERLREEEKKQAQTSCEEIPYYDASLAYTEIMVCKDIPAYSLLKRKNNVFFGLSKNIGKSSYDNRDHSLVELTSVTEEFLQYMTEDLLSDEFDLNPFSDEEKKGMQMYFEFMSKCFEQHIGITLTVAEYLNFKSYYNKVVLLMFELERKQKEDYYRALDLTDSYMSYMASYDLKCADEKEMIISNLIFEENKGYVDDLDLILKNHIVDKDAEENIRGLEKSILEFHKKEEKQEIQTVDAKKESEIIPVAEPYSGNFMPGYPVQMLPNGMMQIVVQILNQNHEVVDEALYAGSNIKQALVDYETRNAQIKRLGLRSNGTDVFYKEEVK